MTAMNENETPDQAPETPAAAEPAAPTAPAESAPAEAPPVAPPPVAAPDPVAALSAERDRFRDQLHRSLADFDNYRKRTQREKQDEYRRGKEDTIRELLAVFDNLERAAASSARPDADVAAIARGIEMVLKLFGDALGKLGGKRIVAIGSAFDPNVHEAIAQVESAEHPAGTVAQEFTPGYLLGERLIRPAMVAVSKGSTTAQAPVEGEPTH